MKTTTVPAQITTVEDRFAGGLSLTQLLLLVTPVFINGIIYLLFPPFLKVSMLKVGMSSLIFTSFGIMAIRIRGKIIAVWLSLVMSYRNRPRYYLFNKNDLSHRKLETAKAEFEAKEAVVEAVQLRSSLNLATHDLIRLETAIADPRSNFNFKQSKNGVLSVHITEIQ